MKTLERAWKMIAKYKKMEWIIFSQKNAEK